MKYFRDLGILCASGQRTVFVKRSLSSFGGKFLPYWNSDVRKSLPSHYHPAGHTFSVLLQMGTRLLGARERGGTFLPSHLMPQFSPSWSSWSHRKVRVTAGPWETFHPWGCNWLSPFCPLSRLPIPQPFLHFSVTVMLHWFCLILGENSLSMTCFVPANPQSIWHPMQSLFREK